MSISPKVRMLIAITIVGVVASLTLVLDAGHCCDWLFYPLFPGLAVELLVGGGHGGSAHFHGAFADTVAFAINAAISIACVLLALELIGRIRNRTPTKTRQ